MYNNTERGLETLVTTAELVLSNTTTGSPFVEWVTQTLAAFEEQAMAADGGQQ